MPIPSRGATGRRRLVFAAFVGAASLLLLEVVLQVGSVVVWWQQPAVTPPAAAERVVLCVGDSWTQGAGASDPEARSYPAVLQSLLRERSGEPWTVVNCGQSGQNSREVLERLPAQLREYRPRVVCLLVGQNDYWSMPALLPEGDTASLDHRSYRFRWRLPRLWAWLLGKVTGAGQAGSGQAPVQRTGEQWQRRTVPIDRPHAREEPMPWTTSPAAAVLKNEGWRTRNAEAAWQCFTKAEKLAPDDCQVMQMIASLSRRIGRLDLSRDYLDRLRSRHRESPGYWVSGALLQALLGCEQWQELLDLAVPLLERFPTEGTFWQMRARAEFFLDRIDDAARSIDEAIRVGPEPAHYLWRNKIWLLGRHDVEEAARSMFAGYVVFNDAEFLAEMLLALDEKSFAIAREVARTFSCEPAVRERIELIVGDVIQRHAGDSAGTVLAAHLARMVTACRTHGAVPVLTCYPVAQKAEPQLRRVAQEMEVPFVEMGRRFEARRMATAWAELLAPDGHCNDTGYRWMAEIMFETVLPRLDRSGK